MPGTAGTRRVGALAPLLVLAVVFAGLLVRPLLAAEEPLLAFDLSMVGDDSRMRVTMRFDRETAPGWSLRRQPHRLVVDLPETRFRFSPESTAPAGMVEGVRYGDLGEGRARMILQFAGPFSVERFEIAKSADDGAWRLVADIVRATPGEFEAALASQPALQAPARSTRKTDRLEANRSADDGRFTIVLDPGHGGIDGGAEGLHGTREKTITLAFALELRKLLAETGRFRVVMTRDSDKFLRLDERVRIGRQNEADLFMSIHADTIRYGYVRGATVYTLSEKASDNIAAAIAETENLADAIAGIELPERDTDVADILLDLVRRETQAFSVRFARTLVGELSQQVELIKNPHRSAGFRVLTAHDMPSVLLELGYLSNSKDETLMRDPQWREKAARSIVSAISLFAAARGTEGG
ncbi:MAG: N-acetylmuramoyl-L-alanine amidase [Phyllobacteriaceae bacterium]|nr:N-acetylmuramoyl-L-alanine amidase [Phyllobacteriaceae bacterium]